MAPFCPRGWSTAVNIWKAWSPPMKWAWSRFRTISPTPSQRSPSHEKNQHRSGGRKAGAPAGGPYLAARIAVAAGTGPGGGQCHCDNEDRDTQLYVPQTNNDIIWCFGLDNMQYHCSTAALVGAVQ